MRRDGEYDQPRTMGPFESWTSSLAEATAIGASHQAPVLALEACRAFVAFLTSRAAVRRAERIDPEVRHE